jgi:phosphoenolpyruvate synthase/pyruvate phosphate dikinase
VAPEEDLPLSDENKDTLLRVAARIEEIWPSETRRNLPVFTTNEGTIPYSGSSKCFTAPVGLFRSETAASMSPNQIAIIAKIMQNQATEGDVETLGGLLFRDYKVLDEATSSHNSPFCFRLFDFRKRDHFPPDLQNGLGADVYRGGEALKAYPQLYTLQLETLFSSFCGAIHNGYCTLPRLEIMMPSLRKLEDVETFVQMVEAAAANDYLGRKNDYTIGVMVEQAELCKCIEDVARVVDFIKIGSNDLTASILGLSRGDTTARNLYRQKNGYDPFIHPAPEVFDTVIPDIIERAKKVNPEIKIGICGDHAARPDVIAKLSCLGMREFSVAPTDENLSLLPLRAYLEVFTRTYAPC